MDLAMVQSGLELATSNNKTQKLLEMADVTASDHLAALVEELVLDSPNKNLWIADTKTAANLGAALKPFMPAEGANSGDSSLLTQVDPEARRNLVMALGTVEPKAWENILEPGASPQVMATRFNGAMKDAGFTDPSQRQTMFDAVMAVKNASASEGTTGEANPELGKHVSGLSQALHDLPEHENQKDLKVVADFVAKADEGDINNLQKLQGWAENLAPDENGGYGNLGMKIAGGVLGGLAANQFGGGMGMIATFATLGFAFGGTIMDGISGFIKNMFGFDLKETFNNLIAGAKDKLGFSNTAQAATLDTESEGEPSGTTTEHETVTLSEEAKTFVSGLYERIDEIPAGTTTENATLNEILVNRDRVAAGTMTTEEFTETIAGGYGEEDLLEARSELESIESKAAAASTESTSDANLAAERVATSALEKPADVGGPPR